MSLNRYDKRRDANEAEIIAGLRQVHAEVRQFDRPVDLCVGWAQRWTWLEVKDPAKPPSERRLTKGEAEFMAICHALGLPAAVVLTVEDALQAIGATR